MSGVPKAPSPIPVACSDYSESDSSESEAEEEGTKGYRRGGYHAVKIGESFKAGRYLVHRKLGWGSFSTVWLAWDNLKTRYVALKVQRSSRSCTEVANDEIAILKQIAAEDPEDRKGVVKLLDHFEHPGPNGRHVCMVFEYLGDNLLTLIRHHKYRGLPLDTVRQLASQILVGLDFLHRELSMIHTDLKPENILLLSTLDPSNDPRSSGSLDSVTCAGPQAPQCSPFVLETPKEEHSFDVPGIEYPQPDHSQMGDDRSLKCKIVDLGNACWSYNKFSDEIQTREYRCPEAILGANYSHSADMWSFACIVFELVTGDLLFNPKLDCSNDEAARDENHLALMIDLLGVMPQKIALSGEHSLRFFTRKGELRQIRKMSYWPLDRIFVEKYGFTVDAAQQLADFLCQLLDFDPDRRPTAGQSLLHPWLKHS